MFLCHLAGITFGVEHRYPLVERLCARYPAPADSTPAFVVSAEDGRLPAGDPATLLPPDRQESADICRAVCTRLLDLDGFVLHASAVAVDGRAYLFAAPSKTGKSTHTSLWCQHFGPRAIMLNDDKPILRLQQGQWLAYGTPWSGPHRLDTNTAAPVQGLCLLRQGSENRLTTLSPAQALPRLMGQTLRPADPDRLTRLCALMDDLLRRVPLYELTCTISDEAVETAYKGMSR